MMTWKISYFLNLYSLIGGALIAVYLFSPIHDIIKKSKFSKIVDIVMTIIFLGLIVYGCYEKMEMEKHSGITISPDEYVAHPLYQEITAHVTNNYDYPIYDYSIVIMVREGDLEVNTDLKFDLIEREEKNTSEIPVKGFGLGGISNKYGLSYMELHFNAIEAHSSQKYLVKIHGEKYKDKSTIEFSIGGYKRDPNPIFSMPIKLDKDGNFPQKLPLPDSMKKETHNE